MSESEELRFYQLDHSTSTSSTIKASPKLSSHLELPTADSFLEHHHKLEKSNGVDQSQSDPNLHKFLDFKQDMTASLLQNIAADNTSPAQINNLLRENIFSDNTYTAYAPTTENNNLHINSNTMLQKQTNNPSLEELLATKPPFYTSSDSNNTKSSQVSTNNQSVVDRNIYKAESPSRFVTDLSMLSEYPPQAQSELLSSYQIEQILFLQRQQKQQELQQHLLEQQNTSQNLNAEHLMILQRQHTQQKFQNAQNYATGQTIPTPELASEELMASFFHHNTNKKFHHSSDSNATSSTHNSHLLSTSMQTQLHPRHMMTNDRGPLDSQSSASPYISSLNIQPPRRVTPASIHHVYQQSTLPPSSIFQPHFNNTTNFNTRISSNSTFPPASSVAYSSDNRLNYGQSYNRPSSIHTEDLNSSPMSTISNNTYFMAGSGHQKFPLAQSIPELANAHSISINSAPRKHHFIPSHSLFVGDLSYFCREEDLVQLFSARYGSIIAINLCRGQNQEPLLYGFIELENEEIRDLALQEMNGVEFMGRNLRQVIKLNYLITWKLSNLRFTFGLESIREILS
jgi:hypothetical protein